MPTVAEVIEEARWEDPSFTPQRHTGRVLRGWLADYQDELVGKVAALCPEELAESYTVDLPLADHSAGVALTEELESETIGLRYKKILDWGHVTGTSGERYKLRMLGTRRAQWGEHRFAGAWIENGRLYPIGEAAHWTGFASITFFYVPSPPRTLSSSDELWFDYDAKRVWVTYLARRMAARAPQEVQGSPGDFLAMWIERERQFLEDMAGRHDGFGKVVEVW